MLELLFWTSRDMAPLFYYYALSRKVTCGHHGTLKMASAIFRGESEIRTHGGLASSTVFKTVALNHSAISPSLTVDC